MQYTVKNDTPFQILTSAIVIGPSQTGYQLEVAADGKNFSPLFTVGANVTRQATNLSSGAYYRLNGNVGDVIVNWVRSCVTPGGSGGSGTELSPVTEFPLDAEDGTVVAYNGTASASGVYQYTGEEWVPVGVDDLSAYWSSAQTQSAITIVEDHLFDVEEVTASALTELHEGLMEVSGRSVDLSGYYTSAQTEDAISAATSGKADAANVTANRARIFPTWNEQGIVTGTTGNTFTEDRFYVNNKSFIFPHAARDEKPDTIFAPLSAGTAGDILVSAGNGAPVWSAMTFPTPDVDKAYVDSAITGVQDQLDVIDEVIPAAIVDLNTRKVESTSIHTIWRGTTAEYNAITTKDASTLYIIL